MDNKKPIKAYELPVKLKALTPYNPTESTCRVILDANESFIQLPEGILVKILEALRNTQFNRYPDAATTRLCAAAATRYGVLPEQVVAGNGSDELISVIITAFSSHGNPVMLCDPDFSMYRFYSQICDAVTAPFCKEKMCINVNSLIEQCNILRPALLIFSNPCNPTGVGLTTFDVRRIAQSVDCLVVVDEAYMDFWDQSVIPYLSEIDNVVVLRTCSKAMGMAAIRLGFAIASKKIATAIRASKSPFNVSTLTQTAGEIILNEQDWLDECVKVIKQSKRGLLEGAQSAFESFPERF